MLVLWVVVVVLVVLLALMCILVSCRLSLSPLFSIIFILDSFSVFLSRFPCFCLCGLSLSRLCLSLCLCLPTSFSFSLSCLLFIYTCSLYPFEFSFFLLLFLMWSSEQVWDTTATAAARITYTVSPLTFEEEIIHSMQSQS